MDYTEWLLTSKGIEMSFLSQLCPSYYSNDILEETLHASLYVIIYFLGNILQYMF